MKQIHFLYETVDDLSDKKTDNKTNQAEDEWEVDVERIEHDLECDGRNAQNDE
jgi:hypothetical protein